MLKRRLIPKLQLALKNSYRGPKAVLAITKQFGERRAIGDPLSQAKIYESQLADELILVDIQRDSNSWPILLTTLESMADSLATPIAVGGGIKNFHQVQELLDKGADKIVLNSSALENPKLIDKVSSSYGSQCVIVSIDTRKNKNEKYISYIHSGTKNSGRNIIEFAKESISRGAGEILVTSISKDGQANGLDIELVSIISSNISVPLIASGGCGLAQHFVDGYRNGASGVAAGTFFTQRDQNPIQCRAHIYNAGIPIRVGL